MSFRRDVTGNADRVEWMRPADSTGAACFLCGNEDGNTIVLRARHADPEHGWLDAASCGACSSAWFPELADHLLAYPHETEISDLDHFDLLLHHYFDLVGGLDWKVQIVERVRPVAPSRILEVGCGSGLLLDYIRTMWNADVRGVEPSVYGAAGAERLSLPIAISTLAEAHDLDGQRFDRVVSTEVLEHVPDPAEFLRTVSGALTDDGVLVLTTPRASSLQPSTPFGELYAALSVGGHYFLASPSKLESLTHAAGLEHVHIEDFGMMNVMFASKAPLQVAPKVESEPFLAEYYTAASSNTSNDQRVRLSDSINAYIAVRSTDGGPAVELRALVDQLLNEQFDISIPPGPDTAEAILGCESIFDLGRVAPFNLAEYLFWRGQSDDLSEVERTHVWEVGALFAAAGLNVDPVSMFVGAAKLHRLVKALDGRLPAASGKQLRALLATIPEVEDVTIADPDLRTTVLATARSFKSTATRRLRRASADHTSS